MSEQLELLPPNACTAQHNTMPQEITKAGCSKCGCVGLHACPGHTIPPWTPEKIAEFNRILGQYEQEPPERSPYGIHGNKFPGVIWPDPKKMQFDIARDYDPMAMGNREKPLNLSSYRESPRRRRSDLREAED